MSCFELAAVYDLANMWDMTHLRDTILDFLSKKMSLNEIFAAEQLSLGRRYQRDAWIRDGFKQLIIRSQALLEHEMEMLGYSLSSKLASLREQYVHYWLQDGHDLGWSDSRAYMESCDMQEEQDDTVLFRP
jgi:hypothetical protein